MIEYTKKKVKLNEVSETINVMNIFDYQLVSKENDNYKVILTFSRDDETPYFNQIYNLEKKWKEEMEIPMLPIYIMVMTAFILLTAYLITVLIFKFNLIYFLTLMVPALILIALSAFFHMNRLKKLKIIFLSYNDKKNEYALLAKEMKEYHE